MPTSSSCSSIPSNKIEWDRHLSSTSSCSLSCSSLLDILLITELGKEGACEGGFERPGSTDMLSCASLPEESGCYTTAENDLPQGFLPSNSTAASTDLGAPTACCTTFSSGAAPQAEQPALLLDVLDCNNYFHDSDDTTVPSTIWLKNQQNSPEIHGRVSTQNSTAPHSYLNQLQQRINSSADGAPTHFTSAANCLSDIEWSPFDTMNARDEEWQWEESHVQLSTTPRADTNTTPHKTNMVLGGSSVISTTSFVTQPEPQVKGERPQKDSIQLMLPVHEDKEGWWECSPASNEIMTTSSSLPFCSNINETTDNHGNSVLLRGEHKAFCVSSAVPMFDGTTTQCTVTQQQQEVSLKCANYGLGMVNFESSLFQPSRLLLPFHQPSTLAHIVLSMDVSKDEQVLQMILDHSPSKLPETNKPAAAAGKSNSCTMRQVASDHPHQQTQHHEGMCRGRSCSTSVTPHNQDIFESPFQSCHWLELLSNQDVIDSPEVVSWYW